MRGHKFALFSFVAAAGIVAALLCAPRFNRPHGTTLQTEEDDIREAVFRYQFDHNGSSQQQAAHVYFIGLVVGTNNVDPSFEFMKRFSGNEPRVKTGAACHFVRGKGLLDNGTGEQGLSFFISDIKGISNAEVEVTGGYYEGEVSASVNLYTLIKKRGKWVVVRDKLEVIS